MQSNSGIFQKQFNAIKKKKKLFSYTRCNLILILLLIHITSQLH